jgi:uncharacterized protein (DUF1810 family)
MLSTALRLTRRVPIRSVNLWSMLTSRKISSNIDVPVIKTSRTLNDFSQFYSNSDRDYTTALMEIKSGQKSSHWIWYIFPQLALHGSSSMATYFGLKSLPEAQQYLNDPVLGPRLVEITEAALMWLRSDKMNIRSLMGSSIDAQKLLSCATLFSYAAAGHSAHPLFVELRRKCEELLKTTDTKSEEFCRSSLPPGDAGAELS